MSADSAKDFLILGEASGTLDPDLDVLQRVAAGNVEAFSALVERHQARLVRLCARLLRDPDEAQDAAQEVFLRAYRSAGAFQPRGRVFTWLYRIAVNHCLNRLRRRRLVRFLPFGPTPGREDEAELDPPDQRADSARALGAREDWTLMRQAIAALPAGQQAVLLLAKFEGLSYRQIAHALGITESAVESRLVRAMRTLAKAQESDRSGVSPAGRG